MKLQMPQMRSAIYANSLKSFFSTSFSSPRCTKPIEGRASTTFSSSTTRSKWTGSGNTGCCGPKGITVRAISGNGRFGAAEREFDGGFAKIPLKIYGDPVDFEVEEV